MCVAKIPVFFARSTPLYCINYYFCTIGNLKKSNHETRAIYFLHAYFFMLPDGFFTTSYYCN